MSGPVLPGLRDLDGAGDPGRTLPGRAERRDRLRLEGGADAGSPSSISQRVQRAVETEGDRAGVREGQGAGSEVGGGRLSTVRGYEHRPGQGGGRGAQALQEAHGVVYSACTTPGGAHVPGRGLCQQCQPRRQPHGAGNGSRDGDKRGQGWERSVRPRQGLRGEPPGLSCSKPAWGTGAPFHVGRGRRREGGQRGTAARSRG